jgi:hypothetical protein
MKKITLISLISAISYGSFAGGMGDASSSLSTFMSLEGGYTWNKIDGYDFTVDGVETAGLSSVKDNNNYTGRLAVGIISMIDDDFGATAELGWGYYGRTTLSPEPTTVAPLVTGTYSSKYTLSGFDALLGVAYVQPYYSLSFKAGALIQNMQNTTTSSFALFNNVDSMTTKNNNTAVLPEIKLGASYNINPNWAITGAYIFALGGTTDTTGNYNSGTGNFTLNTDNQNPTINSLLIGVQYTFC